MDCRLLVCSGLAVNVTSSPAGNEKIVLLFVWAPIHLGSHKYKLQYEAYDDERQRVLSAWSVCLLLNLHIHSFHLKS